MVKEATKKRGRPSLDISRRRIVNALKKHRGESNAVKRAAESLGCSRGYVYKIVKADDIRAILNAE